MKSFKNKYYSNAIVLAPIVLAKWQAISSINGETWLNKVSKFAQDYIFSFIGVVLFIVFLSVGAGYLLAGFSPNPEQITYAQKKKIGLAMVGIFFILGALTLVTAISTMF